MQKRHHHTHTEQQPRAEQSIRIKYKTNGETENPEANIHSKQNTHLYIHTCVHLSVC